MMSNPKIAIILGAGFSKCSDLPLQSEFSRELLSTHFRSETDRLITAEIEQFLAFSFSWRIGQIIPPLEDIFTLIDLAANSGHAIGSQYPAKKLRALRRFLIHRVFSILDRRFRSSRVISRLLTQILDHDSNAAFISLNWDIVLEKHLQESHPNRKIAYQVNELPWFNHRQTRAAKTKLIKVHGSANWVYCDNCRQIYFDYDRKLSLHIGASLTPDDIELCGGSRQSVTLHGCPKCHSPVGPHIATFSYRKSFRTSASTLAWIAAEEALSKADKWIFVGYSLPQADYEFLYLLKASELKLAGDQERPKILDVVALDDQGAELRFRQIFGTAINAFEQGGLQSYVGRKLATFLDQRT